ncbi:hypothetical protein [Rhodocaloribacter sp.]
MEEILPIGAGAKRKEMKNEKRFFEDVCAQMGRDRDSFGHSFEAPNSNVPFFLTLPGNDFF